MTGNNEYDALGELFRQRLKDHRMPIDGNGWNEIERRICKRKNKAVIWWWLAGTLAAAASVAALLIFNRPATDDATVVAVSQQIPIEETEIVHQTSPPAPLHRRGEKAASSLSTGNEQNMRYQYTQNLPDNSSITPLLNDSMIQLFSDSVTQLLSDSVTQLLSDSVIPEKLDISLVEDRPEEDDADTEKTGKWLLAAAFGIGGYSDGLGLNDTYDASDASPKAGWDGMGSGNQYAAELSGNIRSFSDMSKEDFTNLVHRPPLSFGLTARKNLGKHGGVESGLVYTYLASRFEWSGYGVHQSLHYVGIPVNMVVYLWDSKPNWRVYLSGGVTAEKGIRAVYRQERQLESEHRITTVKSSSIDGWQWSLNGALGVNYRLEKGWGIYFEPRVGYSFDCNQPTSIRTEWPVYFGIHLGLNYQL